jgi:ATP-dependent protease ClpP protease subunit
LKLVRNNNSEDQTTFNSYDYEHGIIRLYDEINFKTVKEISEFLWSYLDIPPIAITSNGTCITKPLTVEIMSHGGCLKSGMAVYDMFQKLKVAYAQLPSRLQLTTVGIGYVASSATIIYAAGDRRLAYPHTEFLLHQPALTGVGGTSDVILQEGKYLKLVEDEMVAVYSKVCKKKVERVRLDIANKELVLTAEEAIKYGLVHEII